MRFAFVTTEFPTTKPDGGGLASYVGRMSGLLAGAGHQVEIFVPIEANQAHLPPETDWNGCRLHHVRPARSLAARLVNRGLRGLMLTHLAARRYYLSQAGAVAAALERAEAAGGAFDVVQSADHRGIGLAIPARPGRLRVVRCSAAMALYMDCDGRRDPLARMQIALEEAAVAGADLAFAPSRLTAGYYAGKLGRTITVLPTPIHAEPLPDAAPPDPPADLPPRYLLHFAGQLMPRKGTDLVAEALPLALAEAPDLTMVWAGGLDPALRAQLLARLGPAASHVLVLPAQARPALYALIRGATCSVLPSRIDNLPNSVLESLMLGTPVIGSRDSSIDELVEEGVSGLLIENGAATELAGAMVRAWRGQMGLTPGPSWPDSTLGRAFRPEAALAAYLAAITRARAQL
jgi:glycosyltransferase involved in cell wall biosynthesis